MPCICTCLYKEAHIWIEVRHKNTGVISEVYNIECKKGIIVVHGHTLHANHQRHVHFIACGAHSTLTHKFYHTSNFQSVKCVENIGHI